MKNYKKFIGVFSILATCTFSTAGYRFHVPLENSNGGRLPNGSIVIGDSSNVDDSETNTPKLLNFGMLKNIIDLGETITVNWSSSNASYVTLSDSPTIHRNADDSYTFTPSAAGDGSITVTSFDENGQTGETKTLTYTVNSSGPVIYSVTPSNFWASKVLLRNDYDTVTIVGKNIDCVKWEVISLVNSCYDVKKTASPDGYLGINSYSESSDGTQTIVVTPITGNMGITGTGIARIGFKPFNYDQTLTGDIKRFSYNVTEMPYVSILNDGVYKYYNQFSYSNDLSITIPANTQLNFKLMTSGTKMLFEDPSKSISVLNNAAIVVGPYAAGTDITLNLKTTRYAYDQGSFIGTWTKENMGTADYILTVHFE